MAAGVEKENSLRSAGFSSEEIDKWKSDTARTLSDSGFNTKEINEYFGVQEPDMSDTKKYLENNLKTPQQGQKANDFLSSLEAGWQMSVTGLIARQKLPDTFIEENASSVYKIAAMAAQTAGDFPAMVSGGISGSLLGGAAAGPPGAVVGAGAGSFAMPTALREIITKHYERGDIKDFNDFWERSSALFLDTSKSAVVGAATAGVGGTVGKILTPVAKPIVTGTAKTVSEIGTMVAVGKAMEGEVPNAQDFVEAGVLVGAMHGSMKVGGKLREVWANTGIKPEDAAIESQENVLIKQDLISENVPIPEAYANRVEPAKPITEAELTTAEAQKKVVSQIGKQEEPSTLKQFADAAKTEAKHFYADRVDALDPINDAVKALGKDPKKLTPEENPYILARLSKGASGKAIYAIKYGMLDAKTGKTIGKSLEETYLKHAKDAESKDAFNAYLIAKRNIEIESSGRKSGGDIAASEKIVREGFSKYEKDANDIVAYNNGLLKYALDSGVITEKSYDSMVAAGKAYIPFSRIVETDSIKSFGKSSNPLKKLTGSELKIQDPLQSMVENTSLLIKMSEINKAKLGMVNFIESSPEQTLLKKVSNVKPIEIGKAEVAAFFKEQGIDADPEPFLVYRNQNKELTETQFSVMKDGKKVVYETDPELAQAMRHLDGDKVASSMAFKVLNSITSVKKIGITLMPDFLVKNKIRDMVTSGVFTENQSLTLMDHISAIGDMIQVKSGKRNASYEAWVKSGGLTSTLGTFDILLNKDLLKLYEESGVISQTWNVLKKPIDFVRAAADVAEQSTRLAEFKKITKGATEGAALVRGGIASREVSLDFQRIGAKMSALNAITAFQNVSIQGLDKTLRAFKEDPKGVGKKAAIYITAPSIYLWWANKDDERYKQEPRWKKDLFWIIPTDNWKPVTDNSELEGVPDYLVRQNKVGQFEINRGITYRIPKPQELGIVFGSVPERILESWYSSDPKAFKGFGDTMYELVTPSVIPDAITPVVEQVFNKSLFKGTKIIPSSMELVAPEYQYTEYSSETAKALGSMIKHIPGQSQPGSLASPLVLDNYIRSWAGPLGVYATQIADKALTVTRVANPPIKPAWTVVDIPFVKSFVSRYPSYEAQSLKDFYDQYKISTIAINTTNKLIKENHPDYESYVERNTANSLRLKEIKDGIDNMSKVIQIVYADREMSANDKRQVIDGLYYGMIESAKSGNLISIDIEKEVKEQNKLFK